MEIVFKVLKLYHQFCEKRGKCFGCGAQVGILIQEHGHKLLGLRWCLMTSGQLLQQAHFHFYHILAALRLEALEQLVGILYHKSET